jgi:hypothetical protein
MTADPADPGMVDDDLCPERVPARWLIDRDLDAVAAYLDPWILAAEPDHHPDTTAVPLLGTREWVTADKATRNASVALYVLACLAEREPVVIAARLAAEIAAGRTAHLIAMRQASHAISEALTSTRTRPTRPARPYRSTGPAGSGAPARRGGDA